MVITVALLGATCPAREYAQEAIPEDAVKKDISPDVTLYHWFVPVKGRNAYKLRAVAKVESWPRGVWGAEVTVTPVPLCCGAREHSVRWRKSEASQPKFVAELAAGSRYRIAFRFR